jgi:hypothetical protein
MNNVKCNMAWLGTLTVIAATALLAPAVQGGQEKLASAMTETSLEVTKTRKQLDTTMGALKALTGQKEGDLKPAYNTYRAEVAHAQSAAVWTRQTAENMRVQGAQYFADWQQELGGISNPKLRKKAEQRLASVQKRYGSVSKALETAGAKFTPFLSDLADIEKVLARDLTAGGVKSLRGTVSSAQFNLGPVRRAIDNAAADLEKMSKELRPQAK